jgi:hypothetical protein
MKRLKIYALLPLVAVMSSCSQNEAKPDFKQPDDVIVTASNDLLKVAKDIRESNKQLNILIQQKIAAENIQKPSEVAKTNVPPSLQKNVTLRWNGKAEPAIEMIAQAIGYQYKKPEGKEPVIPLLVSVNSLENNAYDVLRDIGLQLGQKAMLYINPSKKEVGLVYIDTKSNKG